MCVYVCVCVCLTKIYHKNLALLWTPEVHYVNVPVVRAMIWLKYDGRAHNMKS